MRFLLLALIATALAAGETPAPPKAYLGIAIDQAATTLGGSGIAILRVEPGSPAAVMGLTAGDRLTAMDGKPVNNENDLAAVMGAHKPGDDISIDVQRQQGKDGLPQSIKMTGVLQATPRSRTGNLGNQLTDLQERLTNLKKNSEPSLAEVLTRLQEIERDLPKAAEAFKKVYPNGEFRIAISVEITSDKTAKDPLDIEVGGTPAEKQEPAQTLEPAAKPAPGPEPAIKPAKP